LPGAGGCRCEGRAGQGRSGGAGAGQDPGQSVARWKGAGCRQGCPCLWAPAQSSPEVLPAALTPLCPGLQRPPVLGCLRTSWRYPRGAQEHRHPQRHARSPKRLCPRTTDEGLPAPPCRQHPHPLPEQAPRAPCCAGRMEGASAFCYLPHHPLGGTGAEQPPA